MNDVRYVRSSGENVLRDAEIENFRWHDMRHDFASQLVMAGVNILTVKELVGSCQAGTDPPLRPSGPQSEGRGGREVGRVVLS